MVTVLQTAVFIQISFIKELAMFWFGIHLLTGKTAKFIEPLSKIRLKKQFLWEGESKNFDVSYFPMKLVLLKRLRLTI